MKSEIEYEKICDRVSLVFSELANIISTIKNNFHEESAQDPLWRKRPPTYLVQASRLDP